MQPDLNIAITADHAVAVCSTGTLQRVLELHDAVQLD